MTMTLPKFEPLLETEHLCYQINGRSVLKNLNFSIQSGDCIALMGGNGAGKSTLLRLLLGLLPPASGEVLLDGKPQARMTRRAIARWIAYLPQQHSPSFPFSVYQIVLQGRLPLHGHEVLSALCRAGIQYGGVYRLFYDLDDVCGIGYSD